MEIEILKTNEPIYHPPRNCRYGRSHRRRRTPERTAIRDSATQTKVVAAVRALPTGSEHCRIKKTRFDRVVLSFFAAITANAAITAITTVNEGFHALTIRRGFCFHQL